MCPHSATVAPVPIGIRELRAGLSGYVRRAAAGETIVVTVSGRPVAVLAPVNAAPEPSLDDLVALGVVLAPRGRRAAHPVSRERLPVDARSDAELRTVR